MDIIENEKNVQYFLDLIKKSRRGKFKLYIGMIAGVGKSYRMLQEAHELLENGVDVKVGFIETHGLPVQKLSYKGFPLSQEKNFLQRERIGRDGFGCYPSNASRIGYC